MRHLRYLLQMVRGGISVEDLVERGLQYSQIARMLNDAEKQGFINSKDNKLQLSSLGNIKLEELLAKEKIAGSGRWILPEEKRRILKIDKNKIYVPDMKGATF